MLGVEDPVRSMTFVGAFMLRILDEPIVSEPGCAGVDWGSCWFGAEGRLSLLVEGDRSSTGLANLEAVEKSSDMVLCLHSGKDCEPASAAGWSCC